MRKNLAEKRIGERRKMNTGGWATITEYANTDDITVQFDTGETVCHKRYYAFIRGNIAPVHGRRKNNSEIWVGKRKIMNCGLEAVITAYDDSSNITVRFSDGSIVSGRSVYDFRHGQIRPANILQKNKEHKEQYIGTEYDTKHYGRIRIVEYNNSSDITVMFLDTRETAHHRGLVNIRKGCIQPDSKCREKIKIYKRKTYVNAQGIRFSVIDTSTKNGRRKCTLQFEDGTVLGNVTGPVAMCTNHNKNLHPLLPHSGNGCGTKAKSPVRIGNMDLTSTAYVYDGEYNFFCTCPFCGAKDILTAAEARAHICPESERYKEEHEKEGNGNE